MIDDLGRGCGGLKRLLLLTVWRYTTLRPEDAAAREEKKMLNWRINQCSHEYGEVNIRHYIEPYGSF
jgi:hypothetical protein